jgi:hypothetical protein
LRFNLTAAAADPLLIRSRLSLVQAEEEKEMEEEEEEDILRV